MYNWGSGCLLYTSTEAILNRYLYQSNTSNINIIPSKFFIKASENDLELTREKLNLICSYFDKEKMVQEVKT